MARTMVAKHIEPLASGFFRVRIIRNHTLHNIGKFRTLEEAVEARDSFLQELDRPNVEGNGWTTRGVTADEALPDEETVYQRVVGQFRSRTLLEARKASQLIVLPEPVIALTPTADHHIGSGGVDYERMYDDAELIAGTPHMYGATLGDMFEMTILPKMQWLRGEMKIVIPEEHVLVNKYVRTVGPKLLWAVGGNHDLWSLLMAGWDCFADSLRRVRTKALYDRYEVAVTLKVGRSSWRIVARHKWRGYSYFNPFHGIIRAQWQRKPFDIGMGAHAHTGGLFAWFPMEDRTFYGLLANTYKTHDDYRREKGYPASNGVPCVGLLLNGEDRTITPYASLELLARDVRHLY